MKLWIFVILPWSFKDVLCFFFFSKFSFQNSKISIYYVPFAKSKDYFTEFEFWKTSANFQITCHITLLFMSHCDVSQIVKQLCYMKLEICLIQTKIYKEFFVSPKENINKIHSFTCVKNTFFSFVDWLSRKKNTSYLPSHKIQIYS